MRTGVRHVFLKSLCLVALLASCSADPSKPAPQASPSSSRPQVTPSSETAYPTEAEPVGTPQPSPLPRTTPAPEAANEHSPAPEPNDDEALLGAPARPPFQRYPRGGDEDQGEDEEWCAILREATSTTRCARATRFAKNLSTGAGGLRSPNKMIVGQSYQVVFAIASVVENNGNNPTNNTQALSRTLGGPPSVEDQLKISRRMAATLEGDNFLIEPSARQQKDLGISGIQRWSWKVTPTAGDKQELALSVYAVMPDENGVPTDNLIQVLYRPIQVDVAALPAIIKWVSDITGATSNIAKLFTALTALIVAAGGTWLALRTFGTRSSKD